MENAFFKFLADLATRLFSGKPKFFAVVQWIAFVVGGISAAIAYIPTVAQSVPSWLTVVGNVNVVIASVVALIVAQLPKSTE